MQDFPEIDLLFNFPWIPFPYALVIRSSFCNVISMRFPYGVATLKQSLLGCSICVRTGTYESVITIRWQSSFKPRLVKQRALGIDVFQVCEICLACSQSVGRSVVRSACNPCVYTLKLLWDL